MATTKTKVPTTTLAISGLGARQEDIDKALAAGMFVPGTNLKRRLSLLLYGPFGTSKTITAHGLPRTRTLDFDDGMQSVEWAIRQGLIKKDPSEIVYKTILPDPNDGSSTRVIDEAADTVDEWVEEEDIPDSEWDKPYPKLWDTLIIDSGSFLKESAMILAIKENKRLGISKSHEKLLSKGLRATPMMIQDWGTAGSLFLKFIQNCRSIGKNIVLICHEYAEEDDGTLIGIEPLMIGQNRKMVPALFDEVWYAHTKGSRNKPEYLIQTTPDSLHRLRSRIGCLSQVEEADFEGMKNKIAKFYGVDPSTLWEAYHGTEGVAKATEELLREEGANV